MRARVLILLLLASATVSCTSERERNLESAKRGFARLELGMSHEDACWYGGFSPPPADRPYGNYGTDFGRSFSKKEIHLSLHVRQGKLVRVALVKPRYVGGTRQGDEGEVLMEKGVSAAELAAMPFE